MFSEIVKRLWMFFLLLGCCLLIPFLSLLRGSWALLAGNKDRAWEILQGYDRAANAVFNGNSHEYISTRAQRAKMKNKWWGCYLCRFLDYLDKDHCAKSLETVEFRPAPPSK